MATKLIIPDLKYEKYKLANGLDVILQEDCRLPLVAVNLWYHVGPANERPGLTGFAHLFEHMMFEGSRYVGEKAHFLYLESAGATDINGTTDFDRTNYFETLPSNQLELALWLESDRMGFLLDRLDEKKLENQRDVVRNERRQSVEGAPYGLVQEELFHQVFPKDHPYHASVIGSHANIEAARLEDVREFFRLYYAPNNASLAIVGDIDTPKTKALVEKHFGPIPAGPEVPKIRVKTPPITSERRAVIGDQVELPRVYVAWITDPIFTEGDAECDLVARILGGGKSSRLYKKLVYEKRIAQDATAQQYSLALGSVFTVEATAKPGVSADELEAAIDQELEALQTEGPTEAELEGARNIIESAMIRGLETLGGFGGVADRLNQYNHFLGDPGYLPKDLERYYRASTSSLKATLQTRLQRNARVVVHGIPGNKVIDDVPKTVHEPPPVPHPQTETPDQDWRRNPPKPGLQSTLRLPVPELFLLPNGLTIYLVEQHSLPIVSANLIILSGSERNPSGLPGLSSFTAEMLDEGTGRRSALEIAFEADQLGATLSTGSSTDLSYIAVRTLKKNIDPALELMSDVLLRPEFPEHEIERVRHDRLTQILQQKDNPHVLATKVFINCVYGPEHPYGTTEVGTEESNKATGRSELARFWKSGYVPGNAALVVAGDMTQGELRKLGERHLGHWEGRADPFQLPPLGSKAVRRVVIVDKPDSPQTALRLGHVGVTRSNPDYVSIEVMNTGLGGLFSSRINLNLRERHGYTYGASSAFLFRRGQGPFVVATGVRTDVTANAVAEVFNEIDRMRTTLPTPEELATARDSIARSLPGLFETSPQAASSIGQLFAHNLPTDYYQNLPDQIDSVSAEEVRRAAEKYLKPEEMIVVAVGDREQIESQLEKLQLGPIDIRDTSGKPIEAAKLTG
ncbi:MAG TPA: pitrilysin family protein [Acidobacteriota bacterium]|nr:pitrilysin family protein [Acidobacteriota bacterium]